MTTKRIDQLRPIVKELLKERKDATIAAREAKAQKALKEQAFKDTGLARAIITEVAREKRKPGSRTQNQLKKCKDCLKWVPDLEEHVLKEHTKEVEDRIISRSSIEEKVIEAKKELINKVIENEVKTEIAMETAEAAANAIEAAVFSIDDIQDHHKEWIEAYENESGKKAIWKNAITNGFKEWLDINGFH